MDIKLEQLIPLPLTEFEIPDSEIWEADSFIFEGGKSYLIEAPSGKGKTSLLSILYGIRKDYKGKFFLNDAEGATLSAGDWSVYRKEKLSYVFQGLELFEDLSALDNILLKNKMTDYYSEQEIRGMAERLSVESFLHKKAGILSFGQRQRMAIIRALCMPFEFLFADECFSHIDRSNSKIAFELISEECKKRNAGVLLSSLGKTEGSFDETVKL